VTSKAQKVLQSSMTSCEETTQPEVTGVHMLEVVPQCPMQVPSLQISAHSRSAATRAHLHITTIIIWATTICCL